MRIRIRPLREYTDLNACVELQKKTWGAQFDDIVSAALMHVSQKIGGVAAGAYDAEALVGIVFGLTGIRDDRRVHWSHMLAIEPSYQGKSIGRMLKLYQMERVRRIGVGSMYWTFDPLEARNAHFNLNRLGAVVEGYEVDMYGPGTTSPLHAGLGTDRLIVHWDLPAASNRMGAALQRVKWEGDACVLELPFHEESRAAPEVLRQDDDRPLIEIPSHIQSLKAADPERARAARTATRAAFTHYLSQGYRTEKFGRSALTGEWCYRLQRRA